MGSLGPERRRVWRGWRITIGLLAALTFGCEALPWPTPDEVLVLARRGDATSRAIADAFAKRREIPPERILELTLTVGPNERRIDAETYHREIAAPIERHLRLADPDGDIRLLVTTRGLPLYVEDCREGPCERASLDAALAQLGRTDDDRAFQTRPNPLFGHAGRPVPADGPLRFLVARLTAPSATGDARGALPKALADAIERPDLEAPLAQDATDWWLATNEAPDARSAAVSLLLEPVAAQLPHWGQRVCDACPRGRQPDARFGGVVVGSPGALRSAPKGVRLTAPGLVFSLAPVAYDAPTNGERIGDGFDQTVAAWLARGATGIGLHLGDPDVSSVARPAATLLARAQGRTAIEAWFAGVPLLGGSHVFVGDPLRAEPVAGGLETLAADPDGDGLASADDNCPRHHNPDQRDTNGDGIGNRCDADVDDDGLVETSAGQIYPLDERGDLETVALSARGGRYAPDHDLDGDGDVDERDLVIVRLGLYRAPGR